MSILLRQLPYHIIIHIIDYSHTLHIAVPNPKKIPLACFGRFRHDSTRKAMLIFRNIRIRKQIGGLNLMCMARLVKLPFRNIFVPNVSLQKLYKCLDCITKGSKPKYSGCSIHISIDLLSDDLCQIVQSKPVMPHMEYIDPVDGGKWVASIQGLNVTCTWHSILGQGQKVTKYTDA